MEPRFNYTGYGVQGEKYLKTTQLTTTEIAKLIRKQLKKELPICKFSVTTSYFSGGSSITVALMEAPFEVMEPNKNWKNGYAQLNERVIEEGYSNGVNLTKEGIQN